MYGATPNRAGFHLLTGFVLTPAGDAVRLRTNRAASKPHRSQTGDFAGQRPAAQQADSSLQN
jgi:hypothetical protein